MTDDYKYSPQKLPEIEDISLGFGAASEIGLGKISAGEAVDYGSALDQRESDVPPNNFDLSESFPTLSDLGGLTQEEIETLISNNSTDETEVNSLIESYLENNTVGLTADDVDSLIGNYLENNTVGLTADDVDSLIGDYLTENPQGITADDVNSLIGDYLTENPQGITEEQVNSLISGALNNLGVNATCSDGSITVTLTGIPSTPQI